MDGAFNCIITRLLLEVFLLFLIRKKQHESLLALVLFPCTFNYHTLYVAQHISCWQCSNKHLLDSIDFIHPAAEEKCDKMSTHENQSQLAELFQSIKLFSIRRLLINRWLDSMNEETTVRWGEKSLYSQSTPTFQFTHLTSAATAMNQN